MAVKQIGLTPARGSESDADEVERARAQERLVGEEVRLLAGLSHPNVIRFFGAVKVRRWQIAEFLLLHHLFCSP